VKKQLADWGLDYFDLYLIHFPVALEYVDPSVRYPPGWQYEGDEIRPSKASIQETWTAMESLVESGLSKSIGISNFQAQLIYDMLRYAKIKPATLQIEHHPYLVQNDLLRLAKNEGIAVTAYSSFGPASFQEFNMEHASKIQPLLSHDVIGDVAKKHGKSNAQVLLRWATQRGLAVIPKSNRVENMKSNLEALAFDLSEDEIKQISALDINTRFNQPSNVSSKHISHYRKEEQYPLTFAFLIVLPHRVPLDLRLNGSSIKTTESTAATLPSYRGRGSRASIQPLRFFFWPVLEG
jgi:D-xylose reductase